MGCGVLASVRPRPPPPSSDPGAAAVVEPRPRAAGKGRLPRRAAGGRSRCRHSCAASGLLRKISASVHLLLGCLLCWEPNCSFLSSSEDSSSLASEAEGGREGHRREPEASLGCLPRVPRPGIEPGTFWSRDDAPTHGASLARAQATVNVQTAHAHTRFTHGRDGTSTFPRSRGPWGPWCSRWDPSHSLASQMTLLLATPGLTPGDELLEVVTSARRRTSHPRRASARVLGAALAPC